MKGLIKKYGHIWVLSFGLLYLVWFFYLEKTVTRQYHVMHVALDDYIPFNEYFQFCIHLFSGMIISLIVCTFFRNGTDFRPVVDPDKNLCSLLVSRLYQADTCTNVFPSVHVYNSICTHVAIRKSKALRQHRWLQIGSFLLMVSICLATVFLKQHSVIDGVGAGIMAYALYYAVYGSGELSGEKRAARRKAIG